MSLQQTDSPFEPPDENATQLTPRPQHEIPPEGPATLCPVSEHTETEIEICVVISHEVYGNLLHTNRKLIEHDKA